MPAPAAAPTATRASLAACVRSVLHPGALGLAVPFVKP